ncbi:MAG: hypothetical protein HYZ21_00305 [Chloroflexi bacterium]|nr:hypothetical protein [Chloroflexota bacterium]
MTNFPLPLNQDESILKTDSSAAHVRNAALGMGYNVIYGMLWLTDQRLVFRSAILGNTLSYPLSRVAKAERVEVSLSRRQTQFSSQFYDAALRVEFDNVGREYFLTNEIADWAAAISNAKATAPNLPFTQMPPTTSAVEQGARGLWVILGIMAGIVLLFCCSVVACFGLSFLVSLSGQ